MKQIIGYALVFIITFGSCNRIDKKGVDDNATGTIDKVEIDEKAFDDNVSKNEFMVLGTLYHQQAAEYRAMCYQAYNMGKLLLDIDLMDKTIDKHRIVVLDIDETVLDNSPYQAECILSNINYPTRWDEWCSKSSAKAIPGAIDFLTYARSNGVSVYYISNRKEHLKEVTIKNMQNLGFPQADSDHVIMRTNVDVNSKEARRQVLLEKYHISLLFGDNLSDLSSVFDDKLNPAKAAEVDKYQKEFGKRFVVLPNTLYGEWETALYNFNSKQPDSVKTVLRHKGLQGF